MMFMGSEHTREQVKLLVNMASSLVTLMVAAVVTWTASEIKSMGQAIVRLETIQVERTEQMRKMEIVVSQIVPRAELETKLLDINTRLSAQQLETSRLNLEIEKIKNFDSMTHPQSKL